MGFTLLEVLISMAILVFIAMAIYQATTETYKLRESLSTEGNFYNSLRLCSNIIERDIHMIYSPWMTRPPQGVDQQKNHNPPPLDSSDLSVSYQFWSQTTDPNGVRPSRFIGSETKMSFISVSHARIYVDSHESDFVKITYDLKKDEDETQAPEGSVLIRLESTNAFARDDIKDTFLHSYELVHGIKKLSYSYYQRDGNTWKQFKSWDSDKPETKNLVPDVIEAKMEVLGPRQQSFDGIYKFKPEIPLDDVDAIF